MSDAGARLIVCERRGTWASRLRRELDQAGPRVWETRTLADCWEMLAEAPASFIVLELTDANAVELLRRMAWLGRDFPQARAAVVADRALADFGPLAREAGAVHFTCVPRSCGVIARLARRHMDEAGSPPTALAQRIWAKLPWGRRADA